MKIYGLLILVICIAIPRQGLFARSPATDTIPERMEWFQEARLGIFVHWGIYAVNGVRESWSFFEGNISYDDYVAQTEGFTASQYNPGKWAELFKQAGANYAVLTAKHHDGFALWDTKLSDFNAIDQSPAGRDLIEPYCQALRNHDLKVGLYFSHCDWTHSDYPTITPPWMIYKEERNSFAYPPKGEDNVLRWEQFLEFHRGQIKELCTQFDPGLLWFDGDWERSDEQWQMGALKDSVLKWHPETVMNSRMRGHGDYYTPEQTIPITRPDGKWELCMTMNDSWGYQPDDTNYKSMTQIVRTFVECISQGGNLLLDVGPKPDGTIPQPQVKRLKQLGKWIDNHEEAVYSIKPGFKDGHFYGPSAFSTQKNCIYLYLFNHPHSYISVKGIRNDIDTIKVVGSNEPLNWNRSGGAPWVNIPGTLHIEPPQSFNPYVTVLAIHLKGKRDIYRGPGFKESRD